MSALFAYIDPNTGSLLLQLFAAGFVSFLLFFQQVKLFILGLFGYKNNAELDSESMDIPTVKLEQPEQSDNTHKKAA